MTRQPYGGTMFLFKELEPVEPPDELDVINQKLFGAAAVSAFCSECMLRGWATSEPRCDSMPYDVIVDVGQGSRLVRCQVKTTKSICEGTRYHITVARGCDSKLAYTEAEIDVVAAYINAPPVSRWAIIPVREIRGAVSINFPIGGSGGFWCYADQWKQIEMAANKGATT